MIPHTFLFDMDGTLLDSRAAVLDAVAAGLLQAYAHCGIPPGEPNVRRLSDCMGLPSRAYFEQAFDPATVPEKLRTEFASSFGRFTAEQEVAAIDRGETRLYAGVEETLAELKRRGHRLSLFSNAGRVYFDAIVAGHELGRFFDRTLSLGQAGAAGLAQDKAGLVAVLTGDPGRTVVVGDRAHDIAAGRAAGTRTVGCLYGFGNAEEFVDADWLIEAPAELMNLEV